jgi:hypothetical protein
MAGTVMTKKLTPREREIGSLTRFLARFEDKMKAARRARRPISPHAYDSVVMIQNALKKISKQSDKAFDVWQNG